MRWLITCLLLCSTGCQSSSKMTWSMTSDCADVACQKNCVGTCNVCGPRWSPYHRCFDKIRTKHQAVKWARQDLAEMDGCQSESCDFRHGYEQAYIDVAMGASGEVPPLPPSKYWKEWARTPEGHQRAQNWFSGYAAGSARALWSYGEFNHVASSGLTDVADPSNAMHSLSSPAYGY